MDAKPFASLTAGLLARKGAARPAMRRPSLASGVNPMLPVSVQEDLGWNDMGDDAPEHRAASSAVAPPPLTMAAALSARLAELPPRAPARETPLTVAPVAEEAASPAAAAALVRAPVSVPAPAPSPVPRAKKAAPPRAAALSPAGTPAGSKNAANNAINAKAAKVAPRSGRTAFTLRLDPDRHMRLRLACAISRRSAQRLVTEALDVFLDSHPELGGLPQPGSRDAAVSGAGARTERK